MRILLFIALAIAPLALATPPSDSITLQLRDNKGHIVGTHTVVPPQDADDLSPTELLKKIAPAGDETHEASLFWLGSVYRYNPETQSLREVYRGSLAKKSKFRVKDLHAGDIVLFYMESY
jgi:hypothetical protein